MPNWMPPYSPMPTAGLDPSRFAGTQTTNPGAGYAQSPSGPQGASMQPQQQQQLGGLLQRMISGAFGRPLEQQRTVQQATPGAGYALSASSPWRGQGDNTQYDDRGYIMPRQQQQVVQDFALTNPQLAQQQYRDTLSMQNYMQSPSGPFGQFRMPPSP